MALSAQEALTEGYPAAERLGQGTLSPLKGARQAIMADYATLQPYVGAPISLERAETHMGNVTMPMVDQASQAAGAAE